MSEQRVPAQLASADHRYRRLTSFWKWIVVLAIILTVFISINQLFTIDGLTKTFMQGRQQITAIDGLSLQVKPREFFTLVGPSGCGQTTTLRIVAGLEAPSSGRVMFDSEDVTATPTQRRGIAIVFQDIALFPYTSIRENIEYPLRVARLSNKEMVSRVRKVADLLEIGDKLDMRPAQLSGGGSSSEWRLVER